MTGAPARATVLDTTVLSNFAQVDGVELLLDLPRLVTVEGVAEELEAQLFESLDPGEAQALAVAEATNGMVVTDDGDARRTAGQRGVKVTGSIGLLGRFVEDTHISAETADRYLKRWIDDAGFRSPARDFEAFLEE
jgi:predicted nucleic acid-binding protein